MSEQTEWCFERGVDGEGNPNCSLPAGHEGRHSDEPSHESERLHDGMNIDDLNQDPNELSDYVPASRWALRALIGWVALFAAIIGFAVGFLVRGL